MDLKEDPKERKEQIYAILDDPKQNRVELYDKWCNHYDQVIQFNKKRTVLRFYLFNEILGTDTQIIHGIIVD